jgi:hypothetical protein
MIATPRRASEPVAAAWATLLPVSERAEAASMPQRPALAAVVTVWSPRRPALGPAAMVSGRAAEPWRPVAPPTRQARWRLQLTPAMASRSPCRLSRRPKSLGYPVTQTTHALVRRGRLIAATFQCQLTIIAERLWDEQHSIAKAPDNRGRCTEYGRMADAAELMKGMREAGCVA